MLRSVKSLLDFLKNYSEILIKSYSYATLSVRIPEEDKDQTVWCSLRPLILFYAGDTRILPFSLTVKLPEIPSNTARSVSPFPTSRILYPLPNYCRPK